jgi:hypothetical protein
MASDGMLNDITTVSITVTDENDNCPSFTNTTYSAAILSTASIATQVVSLSITDNDLTDNFQATITNGNTKAFFDIEAHTVVVAADLSGVGFATFTLTIKLMDAEQPDCSDMATVTIVILTENVTFQFNASENEPPGTVVGQLIDDPSFPDATYDITDPIWPTPPFTIDNRSTITITDAAPLIGGEQFKLTVAMTVTIGGYKVTVIIKVCIYVIDIPHIDLNGDGVSF